MSKNIVKHGIDLANLPSLSEKAELEALATRLTSEIDYSDIPPLTEEFWKGAVHGRLTSRPRPRLVLLSILGLRT